MKRASAPFLVAPALALVGGALALGSGDDPAARTIAVFPASDQVEAEGYTRGDPVLVEVLRGGGVVASATALPADDPETPRFDGIVSVNHEGGACWERVTPEIRAGDLVRIRSSAGLRAETTVADISVIGGPIANGGEVSLRGAARTPQGQPAIAAQLELRITNGDDRFTGRRRSIRTGRDGVLAVDGGGGWVATFALPPGDVPRALAGSVELSWKGADPAAEVEATVLEVGARGGPMEGCAAPLEGTAPPIAPTAPAASSAPAAASRPPAPPIAPVVTKAATPRARGAGAIAASIQVGGRRFGLSSVRCETRSGRTTLHLAGFVPAGAARPPSSLIASRRTKATRSDRVRVTLAGRTGDLANVQLRMRADGLGGSFVARDAARRRIRGTFVC